MTASSTDTKDTRIVYGARCTWWDSIDKVGHTRPLGQAGHWHSLPACPHCGGVLYEMPDEATFLKGVPAYEAAGHPGYGEMLMWARGRCFGDLHDMEEAYRVEKGRRP